MYSPEIAAYILCLTPTQESQQILSDLLGNFFSGVLIIPKP